MQLVEESNCELLTALASAEPNFVEVAFIAEVLGDSDREIEVQHTMPPVAWHENRLTWVLDTLDYDGKSIGTLRALLLLESWQDFVEILYSFVIFALLEQMLTTDEFLIYARARWHQDPAFMAANARVPSRRTKWILMNLAAGAPRPDQEPPVRWRLLFSHLHRHKQRLIHGKLILSF